MSTHHRMDLEGHILLFLEGGISLPSITANDFTKGFVLHVHRLYARFSEGATIMRILKMIVCKFWLYWISLLYKKKQGFLLCHSLFHSLTKAGFMKYNLWQFNQDKWANYIFKMATIISSIILTIILLCLLCEMNFGTGFVVILPSAVFDSICWTKVLMNAKDRWANFIFKMAAIMQILLSVRSTSFLGEVQGLKSWTLPNKDVLIVRSVIIVIVVFISVLIIDSRWPPLCKFVCEVAEKYGWIWNRHEKIGLGEEFWVYSPSSSVFTTICILKTFKIHSFGGP